MITEDYVSFETAKLLKEKGFNQLTYASFSSDDKETYYGYRMVGNDISRPTLQMAMKWLREIHHIFISIQQHVDMSYVWYIYNDGVPKGCDRESHNNTYEQACEAAIKYVLENLI